LDLATAQLKFAPQRALLVVLCVGGGSLAVAPLAAAAGHASNFPVFRGVRRRLRPRHGHAQEPGRGQQPPLRRLQHLNLIVLLLLLGQLSVSTVFALCASMLLAGAIVLDNTIIEKRGTQVLVLLWTFRTVL
jgi:hypothetical protein